MKKYFVAFGFLFLPVLAHAEKSTRVLTQADVTCSSITINAVQALPNRTNRTGYAFVNLTSVNVRVNFGVSAPGILTSTNSIQIPANNALTDQIPSVTTLPIWCQSTDGTARALSFLEFGQ